MASPTTNGSGGGASVQSEHRREGVTLGTGQPVEVIQHRGAELVEAAVGQLHLGLNARRPCDVPALDTAGQVAQQRALADPSLAAQDQHPTLTFSHTVDQSMEGLAFAPPPYERGPRIAIRHSHPGRCLGATADRIARGENRSTVRIGGCQLAEGLKWIDLLGSRGRAERSSTDATELLSVS